MTINDKIKQILIDKQLTPSYFADEIGVQRSSISHILSGRNRPSFDIIQKIIRRFPELGFDWIMEEESPNNSVPVPNGYTSRSPRSTGIPTNRGINSAVNPNLPSSVGFRSQRTEIPPVAINTDSTNPQAEQSTPATEGNESSLSTTKKVERILIFYTDGSFREYTPAQQ